MRSKCSVNDAALSLCLLEHSTSPLSQKPSFLADSGSTPAHTLQSLCPANVYQIDEVLLDDAVERIDEAGQSTQHTNTSPGNQAMW